MQRNYKKQVIPINNVYLITYTYLKTHKMSKKNFSGGLSSLLGESAEAEMPTIKEKANRIITKTSQEGTKENETRATFIVNEELLEKVKAVAYWERMLLKDVINSAIEDSLAKYVKKNGEIKAVPKK
jgi:hypothetical protein